MDKSKKDNEIDPRCRKTHRPRIDFKSTHLGWFCETCHADLEIDDDYQWVVQKESSQ